MSIMHIYICLICIYISSEPIRPADKESLKLLQEKHPPAHVDCSFPPLHSTTPPPVVSPGDVTKAIFSFPTSSAGGPDGLRPQHLKDLVIYTQSEGSDSLIESLTNFVNFVIGGDVPVGARPFFFGATLTALNKKDGGVRPIAVGCSLRRLAAKCLCKSVFDDMGSLLFPHQLGFGTPMGAEAIVHAARKYLSSLEDGHLLLKLDFRNAFNSIRRDKMLHSVISKAPALLPLTYSTYRLPSLLFYGEFSIPSAEGVQQGNPLGPLLSCLTIHELVTSLKSELNVFFLDDGTLGGPIEDVQADLHLLEDHARDFNLFLNHDKSENICNDEPTRSSMVSLSPSLSVVEPSRATLRRAPIGGLESLNQVWGTKIGQLEILGNRLEQLQSHDAICLLQHALAIPKVLYVLQTAPIFKSSTLAQFDDVLRSLLPSATFDSLTRCGSRLHYQSTWGVWVLGVLPCLRHPPLWPPLLVPLLQL